MSTSRMVSRGSKTRCLAIVCMVLFLSLIIYVVRMSRAELEDVRQTTFSCSRQLESISSQLQVVVDNKLKLERSLEDEKNEHMKTKDELTARIQDEKQLRDKQNLEAVNRYNDLDQTRAALEKEEKDIRDELEILKTNFTEEKRKKDQFQKDLNFALSKISNLERENFKLESDLINNKLQKSNSSPVVKFIQKSNENTNATKSTSVTPVINPQALIEEATAKSSTPMIILKESPTNESPDKPIENNEVNPINQPSMDINSVNESNNVLVSLKETSPPTQESQVGENEPMKAPPRETLILKDQINNSEEDKLSKQKNNAYKYDYEQDRFKEDEDDEDINDFDAREDNQHIRK